MARPQKSIVRVENLTGIVSPSAFMAQVESNPMFFQVTAKNAEVRATVTRFQRAGTGAVVTITGSFTDLSLAAHRVRIDWGDGTATILNFGMRTSGSFRASHSYRALPSRNIVTVTALDSFGTNSMPLNLRLAPLHTTHRRHR